MDSTDAGYIFVPVASCPESCESAFEPLALLNLLVPSWQNDMTLSLGTD